MLLLKSEEKREGPGVGRRGGQGHKRGPKATGMGVGQAWWGRGQRGRRQSELRRTNRARLSNPGSGTQ